MPAYLYKVARIDGTALEGRTEGEDEQTVRAQLEGQGYLVFELRRRGAWPAFLDVPLRGRRALPLQEFLVFNQEFLALVRAGLPILKAVDLLIERTRHPAFRDALLAVRQNVRGGASLSEALSRQPSHFPALYIASVRAGEQSGKLPEVFRQYIAYLKLLIGLREKMAKALTYPAFLVVVGVAVVAFLLTYVLPTFSAVYGEAATTLPPATRGLITLVRALQAHFALVAAAAVVVAAGVRLWTHTPSGRAVWDRTLLRAPLIGEVLTQHHTVQFSRTLATILEAGTPLVDALSIVRGTVSNRVLSAGLLTATERVREGSTLSAALVELQMMPGLALEMIAVGEETGSLETMLRDVAELFEAGLDRKLNQLATWLEPALLLLMGVIVGAIVIIMYLPVFQMAGAIR